LNQSLKEETKRSDEERRNVLLLVKVEVEVEVEENDAA
jgi:hypothetical protein